MPRKAQHSGQYEIDRAKEYFEASIKVGSPDFRYVALAIGAAPVAPPRWAIEACIEEKERQERRSAALGGDAVDSVLDELVRFYDREQQQRDAACEHSAKPTPLRSALIQVYTLLGKARERGADDNWLRSARRAWEKEQKEDRRQSYFRLDGFHITGRIERVLMEIQGPEFGYPADPVRALWLRENSDEGQ